MRYFLFLILLPIISCTSATDKTYERVSIDKYYRQSGMARYFLSELPPWANSSVDANCFRSESVKYLNLKNVRQSFSLSYSDSLQVQYLFNNLLLDAKRLKNRVSSLKEQEQLFFQAMDKVKNGRQLFVVPTFNRVNLIWVDRYLKNPKELNSLMYSSDMNKGRPVLLSMCKSRKELSSFIRRNKIQAEGARLITYEMMSRFDSKNKLNIKEQIELSKIFNKKQLIYLYSKGKRPLGLKGKYKIKK